MRAWRADRAYYAEYARAAWMPLTRKALRARGYRPPSKRCNPGCNDPFCDRR